MNRNEKEAFEGRFKFKGITINTGIVTGQVCLYSAEHHKAAPQFFLKDDNEVNKELQRFEEALLLCSQEMDDIAKKVEEDIGKTESEIFITQKHIMNDSKLVENIKEKVIKEKKNIEWAIFEVLNSFEEKFASFDNQYLSDRATDLGEIRRRLLNRIANKRGSFACEGQIHCQRGVQRIIVASELYADMIVLMDLDKVLGFVTEHGGVTSHAAIIARSLGVPAVSGVNGIMDVVKCGDTIIIDGNNSEVYLNPDEETINKYKKAELSVPEILYPSATPSGMLLLANASTMEDVRLARVMNADGIGLLRTEILFIKADRLIGEEEQYNYYKKIVEIMGDKSVTFRMLDVGGDKPLAFLKMRKEDNPYLGWRGARFLLGNPDIFLTQMRAFARVNKEKRLKVMFPMIIDAEQMKAILELVDKALKDTGVKREEIELGAMFEVPSAFIEAEEILELVDFGSIGSNDLIQYLFAIDRNNELVSSDYKPEHPVLWKTMANLSKIATDMNKPLSICGELAYREGMTEKLLDIGIKILSVPPRIIPKVRKEMVKYVEKRPI